MNRQIDKNLNGPINKETSAKRIRVLIVDDSLVFREVLARGFSSDPSIEVVGTAVDPFEARDKILQFRPDVMTCDIEMPKMNGIQFIKKLLPQYQLPVIVVSSANEAVFDAMNAGAVEFVAKPDIQSVQTVEMFILDMIAKIKIAFHANMKNIQTTTLINESYNNCPTASISDRYNPNRIIAIGASTGGTEAITGILKALPEKVPGIVIVQHIPPVFSKMFADRLNTITKFQVKEAEAGDYLQQGVVLIAPGDQHMRIKKVRDKYIVECFGGERVNGHCPSVDVLFESVAKEAGSAAIGIILTGMGYDGAKGLLAMRRKGSRTIGQDEKSSVVYGMPKVAYEIKAVERQLPLALIPQTILSMLG